jgi:phospholipase C
MSVELTRRELMQRGAAGAAALGLYGLLSDSLAGALTAPPQCGLLSDIEHVVILIQENRSFDHYFGTYRGVRGFSDSNALALRDGSGLKVFAQPSGDLCGGHLYPLRFDTDPSKNGECVNDITHSWGPQHRSWNSGAMDRFVLEHLADDEKNAHNTMGYYTRQDLPFYYALADAFTICDQFFCSVIGPTDPNRLYSMTATLDPDGKNGGPLLETLLSNRASKFGAFTWTTMPEQLEARGISWKVYGNPDGNFGDNVLFYFKNYQSNPVLAEKAFTPTFPGTFESDAASGQLPQISWVLSPLVETEHPPAPVTWGEDAAHTALSALTSNPQVWAKTALFITYDENGGFFDHLPPPTAPAGTPGEYVTVSTLPSAAQGIRGPIGLGFRVPMLVASPLSRGGFVCSQAFDLTSTLLFLERRFGAEVPNLSAWRRSVVGDLTAAFNFVAPDQSIPALPATSLADPRVLASDCPTNAPVSFLAEDFPTVKSYPVTCNISTPPQEPGTSRRPSGLVSCPSTPGKASGGGFIDPLTLEVSGLATLLIKSSSDAASVNNKATFGFTAQFKSGDPAPTGNLEYEDHGANVKIKATSFSLLQISGSEQCASGGLHARIVSAAAVNGMPGHQIRVEVDDCGEPGTSDRFEIHVEEPNGYMAGGVLVGGNIQVQKS